MQADQRHELRTPLNQIRGYAEMLMEDASANACEGPVRPLQAVVATVGGLTLETAKPAPDLLALSGQLVHQVREVAERPEEFLRPFATHMSTAAAAFRSLVEGLPVPESAAADAAEAEPIPGAATLLVVDDSARNRQVLSGQLKRQGYNVGTAGSGRQALELLRARAFDGVLLDVRMPGLDGFETLDLIKKDPLLREVPVIMISASDDYQGIIRCIEGGAEDYLAKPFDPVLLRARLKASLEKKTLRDQLVTQEKLASLGSLAAGIAHEIKNPLNFVINFASLASDLAAELQIAIESADQAAIRELMSELRDSLAKIETHGKTADRTVRGMLMHSRKQTGEREKTDVNTLAADAVRLAYHGLRSNDASFNAAIRFHLDRNVPELQVFPQALGRVFLNLAANAFYSVHEKTKTADADYAPCVELSTALLPGRVEIRLRDNGGGVPPGLEKKIFEPFFTTKPGSSGTGLGLSISHEIAARQHGGALTLRTAPGEYAEFTVTLPTGEKQGEAEHGL